jgi:hypothetical protein
MCRLKNKTWIKIYFLIILLGLSLVSRFNYVIDSAGIFNSPNYLEKAANKLINGDMIIITQPNYDSRKLQELKIKNNVKKINTIVIGSSRTMLIRKTTLKSKYNNFMNHSVSSATLNDYIAIIGAYKKIKGTIPKTVIMGIDPWNFNENFNGEQWRSLEEYHTTIENEFTQSKSSENNFSLKYIQQYNKYFQLINITYTKANLNTFIENIKLKNQPKFMITTTTKTDKTILLPDGSRYYSYTERYRTEEDTRILARKFGNSSDTFLRFFTKLSFKEKFKNIIKYLKKQNVNIIIYLSPFHPDSYSLLMKRPDIVNIEDIESFLIKFSKQNSIRLIGSYNPKNVNYKDIDFFDGIHSHDKSLNKIFSKL